MIRCEDVYGGVTWGAEGTFPQGHWDAESGTVLYCPCSLFLRHGAGSPVLDQDSSPISCTTFVSGTFPTQTGLFSVPLPPLPTPGAGHSGSDLSCVPCSLASLGSTGLSLSLRDFQRLVDLTCFCGSHRHLLPPASACVSRWSSPHWPSPACCPPLTPALPAGHLASQPSGLGPS